MAGATDTLKRRRDGPRRTDLADEIHRADVDPQFQRGGRDHHARLPGLEPLFGMEADLPREAAVMRGDYVGTQVLKAFLEIVRDPLRQPSGVDEHQGGTMRANQFGHPVVHIGPDGISGDGAQFVLRHLHAQIKLATVTHIDDNRLRPVADQKISDKFDRTLGGRKPDPLRFRESQRFQPFQRQGQMRAAFIGSQGMDFIDDDRAHGLKHAPAFLCRQQDEQRFRGGHEDVGRAAQHLLSLRHGCVAGPDQHT